MSVRRDPGITRPGHRVSVLLAATAARVIFVTAPLVHPRSARGARVAPSCWCLANGMLRGVPARCSRDVLALGYRRRSVRPEESGRVPFGVPLVGGLRASPADRLRVHEPSALGFRHVHDRPGAAALAVQLASARRYLLAAIAARARTGVDPRDPTDRVARAPVAPVASPPATVRPRTGNHDQQLATRAAIPASSPHRPPPPRWRRSRGSAGTPHRAALAPRIRPSLA